MAVLTPVRPTNVLATIVPVATEAGGDQIVWQGNPIIVLFRNGHASAITVSCAPTAASIDSIAGAVVPPTRSLSISAGAEAVMEWRSSDVAPYLDSNGRIPFTYTGHNTLLTVRVTEASA